MAKAEDQAVAAAAAKDKENKPLPAMAAPTVNLLEAVRMPIAKRCRDKEESFSTVTNLMWIDLLVKEGTLKAGDVEALKTEAKTVKRSGGAQFKEKIEAKDKEIAELKAALAKASG